MKKVTVIGLGYVGLPLLTIIAQSGKYKACGFDINNKIVSDIKNNSIKFDDDIVQKFDFSKINIRASSDAEILKDSDIIIICVPTPVLNDYTPDLKPVKKAAKSIAKYLKPNMMVIMESTVNPGVCEEVVIPILEESALKAGKDFYLAYCPERINPGDKKWNVKNIPRNLGACSDIGLQKAYDFYSGILDADIHKVSNLKIAEASKVIENTFRDINIAFVNELAQSFDAMNIDLLEVINAAGNKPFAFMTHYPSCGVGGHCIPVDPYYLIERAGKSGFDHKFLKIAREINNKMPYYTIELLWKELNNMQKTIKGTAIGLLGLSYKKDISDLRESPALKIMNILKEQGADLYIYDPFVMSQSNVASLDELLDKSEILVIADNHTEFEKMDLQKLKKNNILLVVDGKNCLDKNAILNLGIGYKGIGH